MLKLRRSFCALGYAQSRGLKHGIERTNPYNGGLSDNVGHVLCL